MEASLRKLSWSDSTGRCHLTCLYHCWYRSPQLALAESQLALRCWELPLGIVLHLVASEQPLTPDIFAALNSLKQ